MRRRFLVLLVAVLLLRGWVGVAMAGQMLAHELPPPAAASAVAEAVHGPDCHGMAADEDAAPAESHDGMCGSCLHCEDCSLHALVSVPAIVSGLQPASISVIAGTAFASADVPPGVKPPIS